MSNRDAYSIYQLQRHSERSYHQTKPDKNEMISEEWFAHLTPPRTGKRATGSLKLLSDTEYSYILEKPAREKAVYLSRFKLKE